jgi:hypothetical protein
MTKRQTTKRIKDLCKRLEIYKKLLKVVCNDPRTLEGFCYYLNTPFFDKDINIRDLSELTYKCHNHRAFTNRAYWFSTDKKGWEIRINILCEVIIELEEEVTYLTAKLILPIFNDYCGKYRNVGLCYIIKYCTDLYNIHSILVDLLYKKRKKGRKSWYWWDLDDKQSRINFLNKIITNYEKTNNRI